jgi:hypothetical protein
MIKLVKTPPIMGAAILFIMSEPVPSEYMI